MVLVYYVQVSVMYYEYRMYSEFDGGARGGRCPPGAFRHTAIRKQWCNEYVSMLSN